MGEGLHASLHMRLLAAAAMAGAYYLLSRLGLSFVAESSQTATIWPASGLALAAFVVLGRPWWPWLTAGVFVGNLVAQQAVREDIVVNVGLAAANAAEPLLATLVMAAVAGRGASLQLTLRAVAALAAAVIGANAVTAALGATVLWAGADASFPAAFAHWWLADGVAMLALAPLALVVGGGRVKAPAGALESVLLLATTAAVTATVFLQSDIAVLRYSFLALPAAVIPALRLSSRLVAVNLATMVSIVAIAGARGLGPFIRDDLSGAEQTLVTQGYIAVVAVCTLLVAAVVREVRATSAALAEEHAAATASEARYRLLADHTADLISVHRPHGPATYVSPNTCEILGIPVDQALGRWAADICHPEDRAGVQVALARAATGAEGATMTFRVPRGDGWRWLESTLRPVMSDEGTTVRDIVAATRDITARMETESALRASEQLHRTVLDHLPDAIVTVYDRDLRILAIHGGDLASRRIVPEAFVGRLLADASPRDAEQLLPDLGRALAGQERTLELQAARTGRFYEVSLVPIRTEDDEVTGIVNVTRDITARRESDEQLRHLADHDPLTDLPNRRRFDTELGRHAARVQRYGLTGAVLLVDLDEFKQVNDTLGHAAGDEFLLQAAALLRAELRDTDLIARFGGDEFAILLPEGDAVEAEETARRLVAAARRVVPGARERGEPPMTFSIGAASFTGEDTPDPAAVLQAADAAMYAAKEAGRDRYVISAGTSPHRRAEAERGPRHRPAPAGEPRLAPHADPPHRRERLPRRRAR